MSRCVSCFTVVFTLESIASLIQVIRACRSSAFMQAGTGTSGWTADIAFTPNAGPRQPAARTQKNSGLQGKVAAFSPTGRGPVGFMLRHFG
jgi:hypothetical protein